MNGAARNLVVSNLLAVAAVLSLSGLLPAQQALAQTPPAGPAAAAAGASDDQGPNALSEVQITGSRIVREGYTTPTPVQAISVQEIQDSGRTNVGETLNLLPVFQGSLTNSSQTTSVPESTQTELNLRNLSANRTLILFDGRRLPASNTEAVPNIDLIPDGLIQRVDVVTGGASAVYGSDAIAGVVNFILDTKFEGIKGMVQGGMSGYGDGQSEKVQITAGTSFLGGRLHVLFSGDQHYQAEVLGTQRKWNTTGVSSIQNPAYTTTGHLPQFLQEPCCVATTYPPGGLVLSGPLKGTTFGPGGSVGQYDYGFGRTDPGSLQYGGSWQQSTMSGGSDVATGDATRHWFARVGFDLTENTEVFAEYIGAWDHSIDRCCFNYYQTGIGTIQLSNPYIPAQTVAQAQQLGVTSFLLGDSLRFPRDQFASGGFGANDYRFTDVYVVGAKGKFDAFKTPWSWNTYAQHGISGEDFNIGQAITDRMKAAIQAVRVGSYGPGYTAAAYPNPRGIAAGTITCSSNLLPTGAPGATSDCIPYNVFGTGVVTQAAIDYTQGYAHLREFDKQSIAGVSVTGEPFNDWAGPVSVALNAEWRHEVAHGYNDEISQQVGFFSTNFFPFVGSQSVIEGALETVVPLLKGKPFAEALDFNGAFRETKYSTSGRVSTWKLGLEWTPIDDFRFRGTYSFDIRAPNLSNLFGLQSSHGTTVDPFVGNVSIPSYTSTVGNPDLKAEKAHQLDLGFVFQPSFIPGLHFSADWYRIKITGAIATLPAAFELQDCFATRIPGTFTGTSPYCPLVQRNPDNSLYGITITPFNLASFQAQGIDYQLDYRTRMDRLVDSWAGTMQVSLSLTNTLKLITNTGIPGPTQILDGAGYANAPKWAGVGNLAYDLDPWRFVVTERYVGKLNTSNVYIQCSTDCPAPIPSGFQTINYNPNTGSYFTTNISAQYKFWSGDANQNGTVFLSVDNVLNRNPPWSRITPGQLFFVNTNSSVYNTMGAYARLGVRFRF